MSSSDKRCCYALPDKKASKTLYLSLTIHKDFGLVARKCSRIRCQFSEMIIELRFLPINAYERSSPNISQRI